MIPALVAVARKCKRCCLEIDEAVERKALASRVKPAASPLDRIPEIAEIYARLADTYHGAIDVDDELTDASIAVVDLVWMAA